MSSSVKRLLLIANGVLVLVVSYFAITIFGDRAEEIAMERVDVTCSMIVEGITAGTLDHNQAKVMAESNFTVGEYTPNIRIFEENGDIFMQTDDPSLVGVSGDEVAEFNCSKL